MNFCTPPVITDAPPSTVVRLPPVGTRTVLGQVDAGAAVEPASLVTRVQPPSIGWGEITLPESSMPPSVNPPSAHWMLASATTAESVVAVASGAVFPFEGG